MAQRRRNSRRGGRNSKSGSDPLAVVVLAQILLCGLLVGMSYYAKQSPNEIAVQAQAQVMELMDQPITEVFHFESGEPMEFGYNYSNQFFGSFQKTNLPQGGLFSIIPKKGKDGLLKAPKNASLSPLMVTGPLYAPVEGRITSLFGYRYHPTTNMLDFHTGIDVAAPQSTPIRAALPGEVQEVGVSPIYGNYLILNHGNGLTTRYCHCEEVLAAEGEKLRRGEKIALVGSTGVSTGPHLHFEVIFQGVLYDPLWVMEEVIVT